MIQQNNATTDIAATAIVIHCNQWANARISAQYASVGHNGGKFGALGEQNIHFSFSDMQIIDLVIINVLGSGTNQRNGIAGNQNVRIGWLTAAVNHQIINAVIQDQQRAFGWEHLDIEVRVFADVLSPDTCRINHLLGENIKLSATA
ncbi:Uncharacterised protein [Vibrio cholerae]|nr:Uncharacterised protein [Vibrio cholerae]